MANQSRTQGRKPMSKKEKKNRRRKRKIIIVIIELLILAGVLVWIWFNGKMDKLNTDVTFKGQDVRVELPEETQDVLGEYTTIALFGLDNRDENSYNGGNSDVIMVARIDKDTKEVRLVSVYRDTFLKMADLKNTDAYSKANAAYAVGGPEQAVRMLNTNLDLDIQEYVSFDFSAVAEAVDILGGVEVEITNEEAGHLNNYCVETSKVTGKSYSSLPGAGTYNLNGVQAVSFGRIRYTAGDDFKRTERQRLVVEKMVEKALASDVGTINELIDSVFPKIKTSLSKSEILSLAKDAFNYKMGENAGFPFDIENEVVSISYQKGSQDCVIPADLAANVKQLHDFLYGTTSYQVTDSVQSISDEIVYRTGVRAQKD
ncbi:MAG: LCP family protein [Lachnospiraceae bacterium]|jgi:LCP family protein required for cell wall assembly|nr:LCP family protein [Lachnospiraceae bacterium]MCI8872282.1 LCP family protein [Lachnospiraceae bacterium]MCI9059732.1 LCP family protein [Lachnospiraceae bacterium]